MISDKKIFFAAMILAGLLVGFLAFNLAQETSYCEEIEQKIKQNKTFNGSIACYPPGVLNTNISSSLENRTKLKCICRRRYNGQVQDIAIRVGTQVR